MRTGRRALQCAYSAPNPTTTPHPPPHHKNRCLFEPRQPRALLHQMASRCSASRWCSSTSAAVNGWLLLAHCTVTVAMAGARYGSGSGELATEFARSKSDIAIARVVTARSLKLGGLVTRAGLIRVGAGFLYEILAEGRSCGDARIWSEDQGRGGIIGLGDWLVQKHFAQI
jgi:hypothetical protein